MQIGLESKMDKHTLERNIKRHVRWDGNYEILPFMAEIEGKLEGAMYMIEDEDYLPRDYYKRVIEEIANYIHEAREYLHDKGYDALKKYSSSMPPEMD